jgi:hypothetical protein
MLCPQGHPLPGTDFSAQYCPTCGSALINPCPVGHDNVANARFCRECGRSMGRPSGTAALASVGAAPATTAVVRPTVGEPAAPRRSVGTGATRTPPATTPPNLPGGTGHPRRKGLLAAIVVLAVAVVGVVVALVATAPGSSAPGTVSPAAGAAGGGPTTTGAASASTSTSTTLSAQALPQGQALTALLAQSSGSRSQVGTATAAIASCGDLAGAQSTLTAAQSSRQALLGQLGQLDLSALPQSAALVSALTAAWQSSATSDGSYAQWAADEQAKPCVPNDASDPAYQEALAADGQASTAKARFASLWNPVATSLGLQQWQPGQL